MLSIGGKAGFLVMMFQFPKKKLTPVRIEWVSNNGFVLNLKTSQIETLYLIIMMQHFTIYAQSIGTFF
jgi:hypothetical protein